MRIFVTGATGFIGSAVVQELLGAGHAVLALARSDEAAAALTAAGAQPHRGSLEDLDSLRAATAETDGVAHLGFIHDFSRFAEVSAIDKRAVDTMADVLAGSDRPLVVSSGVALLSPGTLATEDMKPEVSPDVIPRVATERAVDAAAARGVRASAVRFAPSVHGAGDHGFVPNLINIAREKGVAAYVGDGSNRWPGVHRLDAAALYRLALEKGTPGGRYHGVAEEGVPMREIAGVIGRRLGLPVVSKTPEEAADHFGWFTHFASIDCPASSARTRAELGWAPTRPGLLEDLDQPAYFGG